MKWSAANKRVGGNCWHVLECRDVHCFSRISRGILVLVWIWVALKAAVGDESAYSDAQLSGPMLAAGIVCLVGMLLPRSAEQAPIRQPQHPAGQHFRRRHGTHILSDRRRNGVPRSLDLDGRWKRRPTRPAKINGRRVGKQTHLKYRGRIVA